MSTATNNLVVGGTLTVTGNTILSGNLISIPYSNLSLTGATPSTSIITGTLVIGGGAGVAGNIFVGGNINVAGTTIHTGATLLTGATTNAGGITGGGVITTSNTIASTNTTTGALIVSGGAGVAGNIFVGGNINTGTTINLIYSTIPTFTSNNIGWTNITQITAMNTNTFTPTLPIGVYQISVLGNVYFNTSGYSQIVLFPDGTAVKSNFINVGFVFGSSAGGNYLTMTYVSPITITTSGTLAFKIENGSASVSLYSTSFIAISRIA